MKLVVQVRLLPDAEQVGKLRETMERFNSAATFVGLVAFEHRTANVFELRKLCYREVREKFGLSSQQAQLSIKSVSDAYKRDKSRKVSFRRLAAIPFDQRTMSFKGIDKVSLLTIVGRTVVPMLIGSYQNSRMSSAKGQCDLVFRKNKWFLFVTVDVPDGETFEPSDFLGVDLGIDELAADSDGNTYSGKSVEDVRRKYGLQRKRLQRKGTKGSKKKLKRISGKEAKFRRSENHRISKAIVKSAKGTGRGIALEDLKHIRSRITAWGSEARGRLSGWSFGQLTEFINYKSRLAGVIVEIVDPAYTSRTCSKCGHCEKSNRKSRSEFRCKACRHEQHADVNAARNIAFRALGAIKPPTELAALSG